MIFLPPARQSRGHRAGNYGAIMPDLRETIRAAMTAQHVNQSELARRCHVTPGRVCDYLAGRRDLTGETLDRALAALGLRIAKGKK